MPASRYAGKLATCSTGRLMLPTSHVRRDRVGADGFYAVKRAAGGASGTRFV